MAPPDLSHWYHHNLNPFAVVWGDIRIPWYWLVYVAGWFWCAWSFAKTKSLIKKPADDQTIHDFLLWGWISLLLGARIIYVLFYNPEYFIRHPDQLASLWNGGMSFHGGFLGIAISALVIARYRKTSLFALTDPVALAIPWILMLGRIANFLNGELPGRISSVAWAVVFPPPYDSEPRHPSQLYEAFAEGLVVGLILFCFRRRLLRTPGMASVAFTASYAMARFMVEFTREPDPQLGLLLGLSMGQWLCVVMMITATVVASRLSPSKELDN